MSVRRALALVAPVAALLAFAAPSAMAAPPGFAFLEVPATARGAAMGGAYSALARGVDAAFWNPAGLSDVNGTQVSATHIEWIQGLKHDQFALAGQLFGGGLAASLRAMYSQPIDERDDLGNLVGSFGAHDLEFQLGYGWHAPGGTSWGITSQAVRERIANEAATTWSVGAGGIWQPKRFKDVRVSASANHLGPSARYTVDGQQGAPVNLPASLQSGFAWHKALSKSYSLESAFEARMTRGRQAVLAVGGELTSTVGASLRMGVREGDDLTNFSAGLGYVVGGFGVDYAWVPSKLDLGDTHRFSVNARF